MLLVVMLHCMLLHTYFWYLFICWQLSKYCDSLCVICKKTPMFRYYSWHFGCISQCVRWWRTFSHWCMHSMHKIAQCTANSHRVFSANFMCTRWLRSYWLLFAKEQPIVGERAAAKQICTSVTKRRTTGRCGAHKHSVPQSGPRLYDASASDDVLGSI